MSAASLTGDSAASTAGQGAPPVAERMVWIDLFRGVAVVLMIETHVCNTFLALVFRSDPMFSWLNFWNGLVAPGFLFIAGYLPGLFLRAQRGKVSARKWRRVGGLLVLGYALHMPFDPWLKAGQALDAWKMGTVIDVLQCLGVSLLLVLALQRWGGRLAAGGLLLGAMGAVGFADAAQGWRGLPIPVQAFLNGSTGSLFPLFPWPAFVFSGVLAGMWAAQAGGSPIRQAVRELALPLLVWALRLGLENPGAWQSGSAAFFCQRLAWVLGLAWAAKWLLAWAQPAWLLLAGRQSLVMYVSHLLLISWLATAGVATLGWYATGLTYLGVLLASWLAARKWEAWEGARKRGRAVPSGL